MIINSDNDIQWIAFPIDGQWPTRQAEGHVDFIGEWFYALLDSEG